MQWLRYNFLLENYNVIKCYYVRASVFEVRKGNVKYFGISSKNLNPFLMQSVCGPSAAILYTCLICHHMSKYSNT